MTKRVMKFTPHPYGTPLPPYDPPILEFRKGLDGFLVWAGGEYFWPSKVALQIIGYYGVLEEV